MAIKIDIKTMPPSGHLVCRTNTYIPDVHLNRNPSDSSHQRIFAKPIRVYPYKKNKNGIVMIMRKSLDPDIEDYQVPVTEEILTKCFGLLDPEAPEDPEDPKAL